MSIYIGALLGAALLIGCRTDVKTPLKVEKVPGDSVPIESEDYQAIAPYGPYIVKMRIDPVELDLHIMLFKDERHVDSLVIESVQDFSFESEQSFFVVTTYNYGGQLDVKKIYLQFVEGRIEQPLAFVSRRQHAAPVAEAEEADKYMASVQWREDDTFFVEEWYHGSRELYRDTARLHYDLAGRLFYNVKSATTICCLPEGLIGSRLFVSDSLYLATDRSRYYRYGNHWYYSLESERLSCLAPLY